MNFSGPFYLLLFIVMFSCITAAEGQQKNNAAPNIQEINTGEIKINETVIAIINATIIDGKGGAPVVNGVVIIKENKIEAVGVAGKIAIPKNAVIQMLKECHCCRVLLIRIFTWIIMHGLPALFLQHGVTSVRDPGAWIETYDPERNSGKMIPRLFLTGPHMDMYPPAYPDDAVIVRDSLEAIQQVDRLFATGATAVKIYFRIPVGMIRQICKHVHKYGLPVTAHLEIAEAVQAIEAGARWH